jgi:hypothetical protein
MTESKLSFFPSPRSFTVGIRLHGCHTFYEHNLFKRCAPVPHPIEIELMAAGLR